MPAAIASFKLLGMALMTHSRKCVTLTIRKSTPERNTAPRAVCQGYPMPFTTP